MATIVTRTGKGSALTFAEVDANFTNLNVETTDNTGHIATLTSGKLDKTGGTITGALAVNGNLTLGANLLASSVANSQSGATVTLTVPGNEVVRLTNSLLTQVSGIGAGSAGQKLIILNRTGTTVEFENESPSAALPADQMYTGTGGSLILQNNAAISLVYDGTASRWNIIGGTGSGAGAGGINYILNPDAAVGITGYVPYNDGTAVPVDGSGGTPPAGLWVRSTTTPLRGSGDFNLVKTGAVSYQGAGVAYDFTIDRADLAKVLTITFDYEVLSGTYASGDVAVYIIQDPAGTPVVIQPAGYQVQAATVGTTVRQIATFQTASNVTSYRLCIHVASASTQNYTLALDNISVGPQVVQYGAPITDWQDYTPTGAWTLSNITYSGKWRRVGSNLEVSAKIAINATLLAGDPANPTISIPAGLSIDFTKLADAGSTDPLGWARLFDSGTNTYAAALKVATSTTVAIDALVVRTHAGTVATDFGTPVSKTFPFTFTSSDAITVEFSVPIVGWSSTVQMSNDTDTRVVAASYVGTSIAISAAATFKPTTKSFDTHSAFNTATGVYTVPVPGIYRVSTTGYTNVTAAATRVDPYIYKNGAPVTGLTAVFNSGANSVRVPMTFSGLVSCIAGETLSVVTATVVGVSSIDEGGLNIERLSGPSAIAASETVAASYYLNANQAVTANVTPINFNTKIFDTHGSVTTGASWRFTAPVAGKYDFVTVQYAGASAFDVMVYKNGSVLMGGTGAISGIVGTAINTIDLLAGDYIEFRSNASVTIQGGLLTSSTTGKVHIKRVGN